MADWIQATHLDTSYIVSKDLWEMVVVGGILGVRGREGNWSAVFMAVAMLTVQQRRQNFSNWSFHMEFGLVAAAAA